jgi:hypothetical protein
MEPVIPLYPFVTIYVQGHMAPRYHGAKYAGPTGMDIRVDGRDRRITVPKSKEMIPNMYIYNELNDVSYDCSCNPCHWWCSCAHWMNDWELGIEGNTRWPHNLMTKMNFGGSDDVAQCVLAVRTCIKETDKKIVLFGSSRGAATVLVALTLLTSEELERIGLVVAEAPFSSITSFIERMKLPIPTTWVLSILESFTQFERKQLSPLDAVQSESFPLSKPILFVTSLRDGVISPEETLLLIETLQKRGASNLHHLELKHSHHAAMSIQGKTDMELYYSTLHQLYEKYFS